MEVPPNGRGEPVGVIETQYRRRGQPPCSNCGSQVASLATLMVLCFVLLLLLSTRPGLLFVGPGILRFFLCCFTGLWFCPSYPLTGLQLALLWFSQPFLLGHLYLL